eukprot:7598715-Alexandrium_andersonii.AAC.1
MGARTAASAHGGRGERRAGVPALGGSSSAHGGRTIALGDGGDAHTGEASALGGESTLATLGGVRHTTGEDRLSRIMRKCLIAIPHPALGGAQTALNENVQAAEGAIIPVQRGTVICRGPGGISPPGKPNQKGEYSMERQTLSSRGG